MKKAKRTMQTISILLGILLLIPIAACREPSDQEKALSTVKKFIQAADQFDLPAIYECYDPAINNIAEGATNALGSVFGIDNAAGLAKSFGGLLSQSYLEALGLEISLEFNHVTEQHFDKNRGSIAAECTFILKKEDISCELPIIMRFTMVKKSENWYVSQEPESALIDEALAEQKIQEWFLKVAPSFNPGGEN